MFQMNALALTTAFFAASLDSWIAVAQNIPVTLVENSWTASKLNVAIARKIIAENFLDADVYVRSDFPSNTQALDALAGGTLGAAAVLEVWPSSVADMYSDLETSGAVDSLGELGVTGRIGMFVPNYVIEQYPDAGNYEFYQKYSTANMFATPETDPLGRFLSVSQGYSVLDAQIITNLELPFTQVFSGSEEDSVAILDAAVANNEPILMYWWTPTAEVSHYGLTRVALPPVTQECLISIKNADGLYNCDYPADPLFKVASASLKTEAPSVYDFLEAFTITDEMQLELLPRITFGGETVESVAADWVLQNRAIWERWVLGETARPTIAPTTSMPPTLAPSLSPTNATVVTAQPTSDANATEAPVTAPPSPSPSPSPAPSGAFRALIGASSIVLAPLLSALAWSALA